MDDLMQEVEERLHLIETNLPTKVDGMELSSISKLPFKAICYRESLAWRMAELSRAAFASLQANQLAAAILLTRAAVETSAGLWYAHKKLEAAVQDGTKGKIDEDLMKLTMGRRIDKNSNSVFPEAVQVLNFVDRVDRKVKGFRHQYDQLSEFAHPNYDGTGGLYS
ncbi:MAG TPA: hypothetical protein VGK36_04620 [Candidatus Angelobacter sp.]